MIFDPPLAICGQGAVSPYGTGVHPLIHGKQALEEQVPSREKAQKSYRAYRANFSKERLAYWQKEARLRRAPPIALFMMEAASQACQGHLLDPKRLGIVSTYFTGSIIYTQRFFSEILEQGQRFASPILFPETVFNSPTSHVANVLRCSGPCYSIVGDESSWTHAVSIAAGWLNSRLVDYVLVIGAEELEPVVLDAYAQARWIRSNGKFIPSEGAGALLLRRAYPEDRYRICQVSEGFTYRNPIQARRSARTCMEQFPEKQKVFRTSEYNWFSKIEDELHQERKLISPASFPYAGEAFTASAAWHTIRALSCLSEEWDRLVVPTWGLNEQCSALLLGFAAEK